MLFGCGPTRRRRLVAFAATRAGPYRFDNDTGVWAGILDLTAPMTTYWDVESLDDRVRFATYGRGIWDYLMHELSIAMSGSGGGTITSSPEGIDCGADCSQLGWQACSAPKNLNLLTRASDTETRNNIFRNMLQTGVLPRLGARRRDTGMEYKVIVVSAVKSIGTNYDKACQELAEKVNEQLLWGWSPQGGLAVGETQGLKQPYIMQALVKN